MPKKGKGKEFIPIGKIVGAHGIHGRVKLLYFSHLEAFPYSTIYLQEPTGTFQHLDVCSVLPLKGALALKVAGIHSRDEAQSLKGKLVFCRREAFPRAEPDEFYWIDLIGMDVYAPDTSRSGRVKGVIETGGTDVLEIEMEGKETLVPLSYTWIEEISPEDGRLVLKAGTLEYFDVH